MLYCLFPPDIITVDVDLPASKSISNRVLILNALSNSTYIPSNLSYCDDTRYMYEALTNIDDNVKYVGASGTAMRFLTAFYSQQPGEYILCGTKRMHDRPIYALVDALSAMGADIEYLEKEGFPPLKIRGRELVGGDVYLSGNISSQFISALLMIAPSLKKGMRLFLRDEAVSKPYILLTMKMMKDFGVDVEWNANCISVSHQEYKPHVYEVEADWSSASYWYSFAALADNAEVKLKGLRENSMQGDSNIVNLFTDLGVVTHFTKRGVTLEKIAVASSKFFHNFVNEPDLAQTFIVTCCLLKRHFLFTGLQTLRIKETDRINALTNELKKLGYILKVTGDDMIEWDGEMTSFGPQPCINTYDDHRMAMAFAPASVYFPGICINNPEVVSKSYFSFWNDLRIADFTIMQK